MTVRAKAELSRLLGSNAAPIKAIWAKSTCSGELQVQVVNHDGKLDSVYIPSSLPHGSKGINLLHYATPAQWKKSRSLLAAVSLGHLTVMVEKTP